MERHHDRERETNDASRTIVIHDSAPRERHIANDPDALSNPEPELPRLVLRLQGAQATTSTTRKKKGQRVVWKEDVIDNEGCGKKSSKICCIYHKPRKFDESSDESDPSSGSDCDHSNTGGSGNKGKSKRIMKDHSSHNAYESQPKPT